MCRLLQNAATSVLGQELISYAKYLGIKTINIVRRQEAVNELKLKGYELPQAALCFTSSSPQTTRSDSFFIRAYHKEAALLGRRPNAACCRADVVLVGSEVDIVEEVRKATGDISAALPAMQRLSVRTKPMQVLLMECALLSGTDSRTPEAMGVWFADMQAVTWHGVP